MPVKDMIQENAPHAAGDARIPIPMVPEGSKLH
jgi:hypothetical protein